MLKDDHCNSSFVLSLLLHSMEWLSREKINTSRIDSSRKRTKYRQKIKYWIVYDSQKMVQLTVDTKVPSLYSLEREHPTLHDNERLHNQMIMQVKRPLKSEKSLKEMLQNIQRYTSNRNLCWNYPQIIMRQVPHCSCNCSVPESSHQFLS